VAARHIIAELVRLGAIGAVSTHDLDLASAGELTGMGVPVHFADDVVQREDGPEMSFDYRLRPGLATSTNALKLMELVGFTMPSGNGSVAQDEPSRSR
jgi:DNA mismatch repair ATPase MutS